MYAIIETGGKQYRVEEGDVIDVELLDTASEQIEFKNVLLVHQGEEVKLGTPYLPKCIVHGEWLQESKGPKVIAFKYKQRKGIRRKVGHRQKYARVKITAIAAG